MKNFRNDIKINDLAQPFLEQIIEQMTTVFDPEIELDIYNLGLIYEINIDENKWSLLLPYDLYRYWLWL